ncbi:unnamed protein product [Durusdinium trenchii]|uniref:Uncharacterized protein n=1 Tax=Durusdinium trenchii TaxID=1381693 RepID=A0ABP0JWB2_9DINO
MRVALEMLKYILDLALNPLGRAPSAGECSGKLERLCGSLEGAREELLKAWATSKTAGSETAAADDETATASLHATAALCTLHPTGQGFDGLVVEMASFALFYFQWLKVEEKEAELQAWQRQVEEALKAKRCLTNCFSWFRAADRCSNSSLAAGCWAALVPGSTRAPPVLGRIGA